MRTHVQLSINLTRSSLTARLERADCKEQLDFAERWVVYHDT